MEKLQFKNKNDGRLLKVLCKQYPNISFSSFSSALRKKDVMVNGVRQKENIKVQNNDEICVYISQIQKRELFEVFFEDDNVLVINKQKCIEVCDGDDNVQKQLLQKGINAKAVHRIDKNTSGLVLFAKNEKTKQELISELKKGNIKKFYIAKVLGKAKPSACLEAFLLKDEKNSVVKIFDTFVDGAEKIKTNYVLLASDEQTSLLEVELFSGKTHQIRAHLAHVGLPIVGDGKYGDNKKNKEYKKSKQCLLAYKLVFDLPKQSFLSYLNKNRFELDKKV